MAAIDLSWPAATAVMAGMAFVFGIVSRGKVSASDCEKKHERLDETITDIDRAKVSLQEQVKTLFTLSEQQNKLIDRQTDLIAEVEKMLRKDGRNV